MAINFASAANKAAVCFEHQDVQGMRHLYEQLIVETSLSSDAKIFKLSLVSYALSKVISKPRFWRQNRQDPFWSEVRRMLRRMEGFASQGRENEAAEELDTLIDTIKTVDDKDRRFVRSLLDKAQVKAASGLYARGISLGRASEITGLDKREILSYAGQTMMNERMPPEIGVDERIKRMRRLFGMKVR